MGSIESLDRPAASAAGAVRAALIELTRVVDVLQAGSLDGLDDHEVLAVFKGGLPGLGNALARALGCRVKLGLPLLTSPRRSRVSFAALLL